MTVPSTNRSQSYPGTGLQTAFPFTFRVPKASDLRVVVTHANGTKDELVAGVGYTVVGIGLPNGGTVTTTAAPIVGDTLTVLREVALTQELDLRNQGPYFAEDVEAALDRSTMADQQIQEQVSRSIRLPESESGGSAIVLPTAAQRAGQALTFDAAGNPTATSPSSAAVSAAMQPVAASATLALARAAMGPWGDAVLNTGDRTLLQQRGDTINVKDYPYLAKGDGVTDDSAAIQAAIAAAPAGGVVFLPAGTYKIGASLSIAKSVAFVGQPSRENYDNSWDLSGGTRLLYTPTTGNAISIAAPNAANSRITVSLRDFTVRGSRVAYAGTAGSCIDVDGRTQSGTFVRLDVSNVHVCEAPDHGFYLHGAVYGGTIANVFAHRNGKNGVRAISGSDPIGEMMLSRIRCFENGQNGTTDQNKCGILWLAGTLCAQQMSCSMNTGPGAILGGGPVVINQLQLESNTGTAQLVVGQSGVGVQSLVVSGLMSAPGAGYTGSHVYITQYAVRVALLGGYMSDTLGAGGKHIYREAGSTEIIVQGLGSAAAWSATDLSSAGQAHHMCHVFARDAAGLTNATGDATDVTWKPDTEILDSHNAYNAATGIFTAPLSGLYTIEVSIPVNGLAAGHDRATVFFNATSYGRTKRIGNIGAMRSANNEYTIEARAMVPMKQGETISVTYNVTGSTKTTGATGGSTYGFLSISTAH